MNASSLDPLGVRAEGEGSGSDCLFLGNRTGSAEGSNCACSLLSGGDFPLFGDSEKVPH